jgi:hypothetical protein
LYIIYARTSVKKCQPVLVCFPVPFLSTASGRKQQKGAAESGAHLSLLPLLVPSFSFTLVLHTVHHRMSFAPSSRGETECTSASKASAVGGSSGGVSATASPPSTSVPPGGVARSCGSPIHPSRTTVQRVNGGSSPPTPVPPSRGCSASSSSAVVATATTTTTATAETTGLVVAAASSGSADAGGACATPPPLNLASPGAAPLSPVTALTTLVPHRPHASNPATSTGGSQRSGSGNTQDVTLPPLTRPNASHMPLGDLRAVTAPSAIPAAAPFSSSTGFPDIVVPPLVASSVVEAGEREKEKVKTEERRTKTTATVAVRTVAAQPFASSGPVGFSSPTPVDAPATSRGPPPPSSANGAGVAPGSAVPHPQSTSEPYFRDNNIPHLFNELSEALLELRPENPVAFMTEWLRRRRDALR